MDLLIFQEILCETRPLVIIETGTAAGGSAFFFASLLDLLGTGEVVTVDIVDECHVRHPRITRFIGSSTDPDVVEQIRVRVHGRPWSSLILATAKSMSSGKWSCTVPSSL